MGLEPKVLAEPPLIGREAELNQLMSSLDSALGGRGIIILVSGQTGSGKAIVSTRRQNFYLNYFK
jgi:Cdc6-like AAA superfamily ATPase